VHFSECQIRLCFFFVSFSFFGFKSFSKLFLEGQFLEVFDNFSFWHAEEKSQALIWNQWGHWHLKHIIYIETDVIFGNFTFYRPVWQLKKRKNKFFAINNSLFFFHWFFWFVCLFSCQTFYSKKKNNWKNFSISTWFMYCNLKNW
jgi:hypothetical protein